MVRIIVKYTCALHEINKNTNLDSHFHIELGYTAISIKLVPEQSGKVEYERERLLGFANKFINIFAIPTSILRSYSTFPLCSWLYGVHVRAKAD